MINRRLSFHKCMGQAMAEYLIVVMLFSLAFVVGPDSPLEALMAALSNYYQRFSFAVSRP